MKPKSRRTCPVCHQIAGVHFGGCPEDVADDREPREPDEPDHDAPKPLTSLENWQRNDEHNVP